MKKFLSMGVLSLLLFGMTIPTMASYDESFALEEETSSFDESSLPSQEENNGIMEPVDGSFLLGVDENGNQIAIDENVTIDVTKLNEQINSTTTNEIEIDEKLDEFGMILIDIEEELPDNLGENGLDSTIDIQDTIVGSVDKEIDYGPQPQQQKGNAIIPIIIVVAIIIAIVIGVIVAKKKKR